MKNKYALLPVVMLTCLPVVAEDLIVGAGETYTVTDSQTTLRVDRLVLEDNATIRFADGVAFWDLAAEQALIGKGVTIDASGAPGTDGRVEKAAGSCQHGGAGQDGAVGASGKDGLDLALSLVVKELGSLQIVTDGGNGGVGGTGAQGQFAGSATKCDPTDGGDGGNGGAGGDGGNGGDVTLALTAAEGFEGSLMAVTQRVNFSAEAGEGAEGGAGGKGGVGAEGRYVKQKTLGGSSRWVSGGKPGRNGVKGNSGRGGLTGRVYVGDRGAVSKGVIFGGNKPAGKLTFDDMRPASEEDQAKAIDDLRDQLELLQRRLEELEK